MKRPASVPCSLTVAGSDSGGGAGIQADLKTFAAFGVHGLSALAALTAQNTRQVIAIHEVPEQFLLDQIRAVVTDFAVESAKTGMLAGPAPVRAVARAVRELEIPNLVVDPVIISKSGASLLSAEGISALRHELLPLARVVTPNLPEAETLVDRKLRTPADVREAARDIHSMGPACVVIKGGHHEGEPDDLFYDGARMVLFQGERIRTASDHGTGCTFSAAITALLALGEEPVVAVGEAKRYVGEAMRGASRLGSGHGPVNHFFFLGRFG